MKCQSQDYVREHFVFVSCVSESSSSSSQDVTLPPVLRVAELVIRAKKFIFKDTSDSDVMIQPFYKEWID